MYWVLIVIAGQFQPHAPAFSVDFRTLRECTAAQEKINAYYLSPDNFLHAKAPFTACVKK